MKLNKLWLFPLSFVFILSGLAQAQDEATPTEPTEAKAAENKPTENKTSERRLKRKAARKDLTLPTDPNDDIKHDKKNTADKEANKDSDSAEEIFKSLDYPELQVVPRASDRLQYEAQYEQDKNYLVHWPIVLPSLANIYLGLTANGEYKSGATSSEKDDADLATTSALAVGGFWVAATGFVSAMKPYRSGLSRIRKTDAKDKRGQLFRERISEETLEQQSKTMQTLVRLSIATNLAAAIMVGAKHDVGTESAIVGLLAFTPWIFEHRYINIWNKHLEYKRKIYTPVTGIDFKRDESTHRLVSLVSLRWEF